jgi:hypothetical protein
MFIRFKVTSEFSTVDISTVALDDTGFGYTDTETFSNSLIAATVPLPSESALKKSDTKTPKLGFVKLLIKSTPLAVTHILLHLLMISHLRMCR